jgi:protein tyrosine/serine phosphatase
MRVFTGSRKYRIVSLQAMLAIVGGLLLSGATSAKSNNAFANVHIDNFGQMDERFYRGAQPKERDFQALADLGIKTVIDLRDDAVSYEKRDAEAAGMKYINIPMSDSSYPKDEQIAEFLKIVNDPATGKFYVHCAGGRHRTGVMGAVYRYNYYGWDYDKVYKEMKDYDFYTRWGHGAMKDYVADYWQKIQAGSIHTIASVAAQK